MGIITEDVGSLKQCLGTEDSKLKSREPVNTYFLSTNYMPDAMLEVSQQPREVDSIPI